MDVVVSERLRVLHWVGFGSRWDEEGVVFMDQTHALEGDAFGGLEEGCEGDDFGAEGYFGWVVFVGVRVVDGDDEVLAYLRSCWWREWKLVKKVIDIVGLARGGGWCRRCCIVFILGICCFAKGL